MQASESRLQDAAMAELVEFGRDLVGADLRRRGHEVEAAWPTPAASGSAGWNISFRTVPSLLNLARSAFSATWPAGVDILEHGRQRIGDQGAAVLDGAGHQVPHLAVGALELAVQHDGQGDEDADQGRRASG